MDKVIKIGKNLLMGAGQPLVIQTMWKDKLNGVTESLLARIDKLGAMGCGLLRFAVPDLGAAEVLGELAGASSLPLCADIHFDHRIALRCLDFPIAKLRLNPGNIGGKEEVARVLEKAGAKAVPIRIGVNAGSLPADLRQRVQGRDLTRAAALAQAATRELAVFEEYGFYKVVVSVKASGIADTLNANRLLKERTDAPLHIGLTEAGPLVAGTVRSTTALVALLNEGIGDTVRVSLSDTVENEVIAAREIIGALADMRGTKPPGINVVSCPRCGRASFDTHGFTARWLERFYCSQKTATVAVMGCPVNGPGEARHADLGITGTGDKLVLFKHGEILRTVSPSEVDAVFAQELENL